MEAQDFKIAYFNFLLPAPFLPSKEINFVSPALFNNKEVHVVLKLETGHLNICENLCIRETWRQVCFYRLSFLLNFCSLQ